MVLDPRRGNDGLHWHVNAAKIESRDAMAEVLSVPLAQRLETNVFMLGRISKLFSGCLLFIRPTAVGGL